jgi:serine/threonine protein kinase
MGTSSQLVGQVLGHYRILEQIGAGGMGVVYRAHDERLDRDVALKVLPRNSLADESARRRFRKEALTLSKLNHANIAQVYDFDTQDVIDFLVMEYVVGVTLAGELANQPLPEKQVLAFGEQIAKTLEEAHEHGIVHRDLKPGNIMVTPKEQVKLLDFGLAKLLRVAGVDVTASFAEEGSTQASTTSACSAIVSLIWRLGSQEQSGRYPTALLRVSHISVHKLRAKGPRRKRTTTSSKFDPMLSLMRLWLLWSAKRCHYD